MIVLPPNPVRGAFGLIGLVCMTAGAWMLWGHATAIFLVGLFCVFDASLDEMIERITHTSRGYSFPRPDGKAQQ